MNTSDQARQQWCPMVRMSTVAPVLVFQPDGKAKRSDIVGSFGGSANTGGEDRRRNDPEYRAAADTRCVADKCAMWRWIDPAPERRDAEIIEAARARRGYCGLAGRPEVMP